MEGIQATLQEVLQWLASLAPPQTVYEEHQEFVQGIRGAGLQRVGRNPQERRFEVQERR